MNWGEVNPTHADYNGSCTIKDTEDPSWSTSFKTKRTQKTSSALEDFICVLFILDMNIKYMLKGYHAFLAHVTTKEIEDNSKKKRLEDVPIVLFVYQEPLNLNLIRTSESKYSIEKSESDSHLNLKNGQEV
ncbi:hypothetical protein Tco_0410764 [Tanacetum coccineum]